LNEKVRIARGTLDVEIMNAIRYEDTG
jgi:hypothetical protein